MCRPGPCACSASCVAERGSLMGDVPGGRPLPPPTARNPGILSPSPSLGCGAMGVSEARPSVPSCQMRSRVVPATTQPKISPLRAAFLRSLRNVLSLLSTLFPSVHLAWPFLVGPPEGAGPESGHGVTREVDGQQQSEHSHRQTDNTHRARK